MTIGAKTPIVVVNSSMLRSFDSRRSRPSWPRGGAVLSEHYGYTTALLLLSQFLLGALPRSLLLGLPVRAMYLALLEWSSCRGALGRPGRGARHGGPAAAVPGADVAGRWLGPGRTSRPSSSRRRLRQRGRPLLAPHPVLVGAEPHPPGGGPARQGAHGVGADRRLRPHPHGDYRGVRGAPPTRSTRTPCALPRALLPHPGPRRAGCRSSASARRLVERLQTPRRRGDDARTTTTSLGPEPGPPARAGPWTALFPPATSAGRQPRLNRAKSHNGALVKKPQFRQGRSVFSSGEPRASGGIRALLEGERAAWCCGAQRPSA